MATKPKPDDDKPPIVTGTVELIVTPELRQKIERKRRQNRLMLGEEVRAKECGEIDLGEIDERGN